MQTAREIGVSSPLGDDVLLFRHMTATEHLGRLFEINLDLLSGDHQIKLADILGQPMSVRLDLPDCDTPRHFHGYVSRFSYVGSQGRHAVYQATLRPWLWFLTRTADCRIFQEKTVPDIIKEIFRDHGFTDFEESLSASYRTWGYCVQYRETDFNFVSRLMEQEGIYYYFKHEETKHTLVLADSYSSHEPVSGYDEVPYYPPDEQDRRERDHISDWLVSQEVQAVNYTLNDYDFERPKAGLVVKSNVAREHDKADYEVYDYPGEYIQTGDGDNYVRTRIEELQAQYERVQGSGNVRGLIAGCLFSLSGYPRSDQDREYLVESISHDLQGNPYESDSSSQAQPIYSCRLTAIDAKQPYRSPRVTPKPVVQGPQTAVVVGPSGEKIWPDKYGRVKVQFHWDREGKNDENSSCWVRASQNWAGKTWGGMFLPHVGHEVIVSFLEGDPDRPIITGRVYNADNMPPGNLPDEKHKSFIRDDYGNEMIFDATPGDEHIRLHSPHHESTMEIGRSVKYTTASDQDQYVVGNSSSTVYGDTSSTQWGNYSNHFYGFKFTTFLGFGIDLWGGASLGVKVGTAAVAALGGAVTATLAFKYSYSKGPEISRGSNVFKKTTSGEIVLDSEEKLTAIGGSDNNSKLVLGTDQLLLDFGSDKRPPQSNEALAYNLAMAAASLGAGAIAAGATSSAKRSKATGLAKTDEPTSDEAGAKAAHEQAKADRAEADKKVKKSTKAVEDKKKELSVAEKEAKDAKADRDKKKQLAADAKTDWDKAEKRAAADPKDAGLRSAADRAKADYEAKKKQADEADTKVTAADGKVTAVKTELKSAEAQVPKDEAAAKAAKAKEDAAKKELDKTEKKRKALAAAAITEMSHTSKTEWTTYTLGAVGIAAGLVTAGITAYRAGKKDKHESARTTLHTITLDDKLGIKLSNKKQKATIHITKSGDIVIMANKEKKIVINGKTVNLRADTFEWKAKTTKVKGKLQSKNFKFD